MKEEITHMARDLAMKGYSKTTQERYVKEAQRLIERFGRPASHLTRDELRQYVEEQQAQCKSPSTLNHRLSAILFLYRRTLGRSELVSFISLARKHSPLPVVLSLKEVHALFGAIRKPVYQAIAMVLYGAGLRIQEALALTVSDIDAARMVIRIRHGKGDKPREAKLSPTLYNWLRNYWAQQQPPGPYLFGSRKTGKPPTAVSVRTALSKAAKDAWIKKPVYPHVLRHSFATHLLEQGTDVHVVGALLGHASLRSTARYARVTQKIVRQTPSPLDLLPQRRL